MKCTASALTLLLAAGSALAADPGPNSAVAASRPHPRQFVFSLIPKSFQTHPELDFHVITEMTPAGRKVAPPTSSRPAYYLAQAGKFTQLGHNTPANEHAPALVSLTRSIEKALAENGYVQATPSSPLPQIVVVFNYGSFARFSTEAYDAQQMVAVEEINQNADPAGAMSGDFMPSSDDRDVDALLPIVLSSQPDRIDILQRAELIGGDKFAGDLAHALDLEASYHAGHAGSAMLEIEKLTSPFHQFMNANTETTELVEESFSSCYFVIASAYDYRSMRLGHRVLLWRTKMTVNSSGISMSESLPSLIVSAGPYLGHDMTGPVTLTKRITREGKVEVGTPEVVDDSARAPSASVPKEARPATR